MKFCEREFGMGGEGYMYPAVLYAPLKLLLMDVSLGARAGCVCVCIYVICSNGDISSFARGQKRTPE